MTTNWLDEHWGYVSDSQRTARFRDALARVLKPGDTVVDLGCGVGILGLVALESGAGRIVGLERTQVGNVARETFARSEHAARARIIRASSYEARLAEPVDVIVCDHVGYFGVDYDIVALLRDARRRFLRPGGRIVPTGLSLYLAPVEAEICARKVMRWTSESVPEPFHWLHRFDANRRHPSQLDESHLLADSARLDDIDLTAEERSFFAWRARFSIARDGDMHGLAGWFDCCLAEGVHMSNSPLAEDRISRPQAFLPIAEPLPVVAGDSIEASVAMRPAEHLIVWTVSHARSGRTFRHSTWEASLLDSDHLRRAGSDHVPRLSDRGKARQVVLGYCDGRRTVREVEAAVLREHPDLMPSPEAVSDFVADVLGRDTE